ncbi:MAG: serine/threonine protein kinase [Planctomycetes bacterium]|nr:serine/threonine protein kinase [Planctomycetota bacterium]
MAPPSDLREFLTLLTRSGLLDSTLLDSLARKLHWSESTDIVEAARALIAEKQLTIFQARELLKGKWRGLAFDGYKLLYPLGSGGMGHVYAAVESSTGWQVAVKVLTDRYRRDIAMLTRIQLEAQAGMRLKHPNILRTLSINRTEDSYGEIFYVVMELVKGVSLNELIAIHKSIPVWRACDIVRQAALGIDSAHHAGLIHRDVKPDNLLIRSDGSVKVLDFGLAMMDENDEEFSMAMIMGQDRLGTADYVAPEQSINSYRVDHRVDVYGLGCTLYFALAGRPPFLAATNAEKIRNHREKKPDAIDLLRPDTPPEIAAIVNKMMAKRPERRFSSASEIAARLEPFSRREPVEFDFARVVKARAKWAKRREAIRKLKERDDTATRAQTTDHPEPPKAEPNPAPFVRNGPEADASAAQAEAKRNAPGVEPR